MANRSGQTPESFEDLIIARALGIYDEVVTPIENASTKSEVNDILERNPHAGPIGERYGEIRKDELDD